MKNNKQKLNLFTFLMLLFFANLSAQIVQKFGDNSFTIDSNAVLELESTNKGLLLPRVALTSTSSISPMTGTLTSGMTVYNTATAGDVTPGFYYYSVNKWVRVADNSSVPASSITGTLGVANGGTGATTAAGALTNLGAQSTSNLSSNVTTNTGSTTMYPSVSAVESYVTSQVAAATPDASTTVKGKIQLAGDLSGTAASPSIAANAVTSAKILDGEIVNADISATAGIVDTKLATIATAGKVSNSATTATSANTVSTIVLRDGSGNFSAGAITATGFSGNGSALTNVTATTNANLTGAITSIGNATSLGTFTSANLATALSDETGTGVAVLATSPTLVTPILGVATGTSLSVSGQLTSTVATGTAPLVVTSTTAVDNLSIGGNAATATLATTATNATNSGITTDIATAVAVYPTFVTATSGNLPQRVASAAKLSFIPSTGILTATGFSGNGSGLTNVTSTTNANLTGAITSIGNATSLGTFTSANLATALSDETGTGVAVLATSPTLVTPVLGVATGTSLSVSGQLTSTIATGIAPLVVTSTTPVANLSIGGNAATATLATTATNATNTGITEDTATAVAVYPTFVTANTGNLPQKVTSTKLSFIPSTGILTATGFSGNGSALTNVTATTNANLTGMVTSNGNATTVVTNANLTGMITSVGNTTSLGSFTSANLATALSDETGSGVAVLATSPTLVTPVLGVATGTSLSVTGQLTSTVATGTAPLVVTSTTPVANLNIGGNAATVTTNANLTGMITSVGNTASLGSFTSSNLATALSDETGTGSAVLAVSPTFTGTPTLPTGTIATTQTAGNNSTAIATTAFVTAAVTTAVNSPSVVTKTADYSATTSDSTILYDTSSAATVEGFTLTIPTAATGNSGKVYVIKKIDPSANKLKFSPSFYTTTSTTVVVSSLNYIKTFRIQSDGTKWYIID